ncbi:MAG: DUF1902 domain-containing protein [Ahrensia sp.]|nr:DUF1902 domain-containing protein [Ahrensia sp.]
MRPTFFVKALWDDEAKVFTSQSDIIGLHIEAETLKEFEELVLDCAVDLVLANHVSPEDIANKPLRDLVPTIVWQRPEIEPVLA